MTDAISEKNLARYEEPRFGEAGSPFCLAQVRAYETDQPKTQRKINYLLDAQTEQSRVRMEQVCNLGGCTLKVTESVEDGRVISGACKAASYCLKTAFKAVGDAPSVDEGRARYREIIQTLEGHADKYNAGNYCPRLDCGLSAGVSIDMIPGTSGKCIEDAICQQPQLPLE